jgi:hypothetical protein
MKDCKFCDKQGLLILPLRYAAVVGEAQALADIPALPATLGMGVKDLALTHGKYAPRMVREGYIYLLQERAGLKYWEGYMVVEDAFLYKFDVKTPPTAQVDFSCDRSTCGIDASCIAIDKVDQVTKAYLLFTSSPMTEAKLDEYKSNADSYVGKGKMQVFDPKAWAKAGSRNQEHSLKPELIGQHVPEWILYKQCKEALSTPLGEAMQQQLFEAKANSSAFAGIPPSAPNLHQPGRLGVLLHKLKEKEGAAFVLHDHIGIAQELNDFRNAALAKIDQFLSKKDPKTKVTNQRNFEVMTAIDDIKKNLANGHFTSSKESLDRMRESGDQYVQQLRFQANILRRQGKIAEAEKKDLETEEFLRTREQNYQLRLKDAREKGKNIWPEKYAPLISQDALDTFNTNLNTTLADAMKLAEIRVNDHLKWFISERFINAFDIFDRKKMCDGFNFSNEAALCSFGMVGVPKSAELMEKWVSATKIERSNIYMRGLLLNQQQLEDDANEAFAKIKSEAAASPSITTLQVAAIVSKNFKSVISGFKSVDSAWDEWIRTKPSKTPDFYKSREGARMFQMSELSRFVMRANMGGKFDKALIGTISAVLYSHLGKLTEKISLEQLMGEIKKDPALAARAANDPAARPLAEAGARNQSAAEKTAVKGSMQELMTDAQRKQADARAGIVRTIEEQVAKPATNNYHQVRIGVVLAGLEIISLVDKLQKGKADEVNWQAIGSVMSLSSIMLDTVYASAKSIREMAGSASAVGQAADIIRGGLKMAAGTLATGAGVIGVFADWGAATNEWSGKRDPLLVAVYGLRALNGAVGSIFAFAAAFSYSGPLLNRVALKFAENSAKRSALEAAGLFAKTVTEGLAVQGTKLLITRVLLLRVIAWISWVGIALTIVEIGYHLLHFLFMDNELQAWCKRSTFRKDMSGNPYESSDKELEELFKSFQAST